jgi:hypothetical protein
MIGLKKSVYPDLENVYDELWKKWEICKHMLECEIDEKYMEIY